MTEETPTLDDAVTISMSQIAQYEGAIRGLNTASDDKEKAEIAQNFADSLVARLGEDPDENLVQMTYNDVLPNPLAYATRASRNIIAASNEAYQGNLELIAHEIETKLNNDLKGAKSKDDAAIAIIPYIQQSIELKERSKEEIYEERIAQLRSVGIQIFGTHTDLVNSKQDLVERYVSLTKELIKEDTDSEDDKKKVYSIDSEKLKAYISNPVVGSILYFTEKPKEKEE